MPVVAAETTETATSRPILLTILTIITPVAVALGLYLALFWVGMDEKQGEVQRLFYIHLSAFAAAFVAFGATVVGGILYLRTRTIRWDILALAGVEVGLTLALINLLTGMIWARPSWNTWWTWDPRLTSEAVMLLTYAAYLMLRNGVENPEQRRRFAAVFGIIAFSTVILTFAITRLKPEDTIHPVVIGTNPQNAKGGFELQSRITTTIAINSTIWSVLVPWTLIWWRIRLENLAERVNALKMKVWNQ
jgi:heme exporter protein C